MDTGKHLANLGNKYLEDKRNSFPLCLVLAASARTELLGSKVGSWHSMNLEMNRSVYGHTQHISVLISLTFCQHSTQGVTTSFPKNSLSGILVSS